MKSRIKIAVVFGTRPEAIKLAPVVLALSKDKRFHALTIVTGQHRQMLDQVLNLFHISPAYDLGVMTEKQSLTRIVSRSVDRLDKVLREVRPDAVLVQGDTSSTFVASLAAFYNRIPVGHVEAGLRTEDRWQPFPEEINRRLTSVLADWHFAPTEIARHNLLREKIKSKSIFVTGNTVVDAFRLALHNIKLNLKLPMAFAGKRIILVTAHRRENHGESMKSICLAISELVHRFPEVAIVFPVHLNPEVRKVVFPFLSKHERVWLTDPLDYFQNVQIIRQSTLILTDSGGIQEEAPILGKPVLILRNTTERPEGVREGVARLVGTKKTRIVQEASKLLSDPQAYRRAATVANPYGDGKAAKRIVDYLLYEFGLRRRLPVPFVSEFNH
jgi:UDP-N-acetylglucosamine 2-epimerase (non-hydrolysing)